MTTIKIREGFYFVLKINMLLSYVQYIFLFLNRRDKYVTAWNCLFWHTNTFSFFTLQVYKSAWFPSNTHSIWTFVWAVPRTPVPNTIRKEFLWTFKKAKHVFQILKFNFNRCFSVHLISTKLFLPTNALFIKT